MCGAILRAVPTSCRPRSRNGERQGDEADRCMIRGKRANL